MSGSGPAFLNPLPAVVWLLALPVIALELVLALAGAGLVPGVEAVEWRWQALERFAFVPDFLLQMWASGEWRFDRLVRLFTYPFVHARFSEALFMLVLLLALGKMVGEVVRPIAVLAVFFAASAAGALAVTAAGAGAEPLLGGFPAVYGLIGAFTFLLWARLGAVGAPRWRAFGLIGMLMGVQLLFAVFAATGPGWIADLAGFGAGFVLTPFFVRGGAARVLAALRRRG
jgi:membrane associated rhomboid family serine protease